MVEFAIVGPLFFLSVFAVLEAALYVNAVVSVNNATREGARAAALCGDATIYQPYQLATTPTGQSTSGLSNSDLCFAQTEKTIDDHLGFLTVIPGTNPGVKETCATGCQAGDTITVTVTYEYNFLFPYLLKLQTPEPINTAVQVVSQQ